MQRLKSGITTLWVIVWVLFMGAGTACDHSEELAYQSGFTDQEDDAQKDENQFYNEAEPVSIAYLKSLLRGDSHTLTESLYIEGRLTANDLYGEYDRSIVVQDASGGIELYIEEQQLCRHYALGAPLRIYCQGLALGDYGGKALLGAPPTGSMPVDRIASTLRTRYIKLLEEEYAPLSPTPISIPELVFEQVGTFIRLEGLCFIHEEQGLTWCEVDSETLLPYSTARHLIDNQGNQLEVYTLSTCHYALEVLPAGEGSIAGILDYFDGNYQLRVVNHDFQFH